MLRGDHPIGVVSPNGSITDQRSQNSAQSANQESADFLRAPATLEETGLSTLFLLELALKILHYTGAATVDHMVNVMALPKPLVDQILTLLKEQQLCEIIGSAGLLPGSYLHRITEKGRLRAEEALQRSRYAGAVPVTLENYIQVIQSRRSKDSPNLSRERIEQALSHLVLGEDVRDAICRALYSGRRVMVFGPSGNGKTDILTSFAKALDGYMVIPRAIYTHGQIIRMYDPMVHEPYVDSALGSGGANDRDEDDSVIYSGEDLLLGKRRDLGWDSRWVKIKRPSIIVGGELTEDSIELVYDSTAGFYQAPIHLKAQGGILVVDDFGRQKISAYDLLNRWIVPLENGWDNLTLHTGETITVPFNVSLFFSTNLQPKDLVDEAFLRRIPYKIPILSPTPDEFKEITRRVCAKYGVLFTEAMLDYLVHKLYREGPTEPRASFPRDLLQIIIENARFDGTQPSLTYDAVDKACHLYFMGELRGVQKDSLRRFCDLYGIQYTEEMLDRLFSRLQQEDTDLTPNAVRELLNIIVETAGSDGQKPTLTPEVIDLATRLYFVTQQESSGQGSSSKGPGVAGLRGPKRLINS